MNPACSTPFRYFRNGKIFNLETVSGSRNERRGEYFWLCGPCSTTMKVTLRDGAPVVVQRFLRLISGELMELCDPEQSYIPDPI